MTEIAETGPVLPAALPAAVPAMLPATPPVVLATVPATAPRDQNSYWVYLGSLPSAASRRTMRLCLDQAAQLLGFADGAMVPWGMLRFQHTARLRTLFIQQTYPGADGRAVAWSPSTINKHLSAVRKVLEQAWMLGLMSAEDYHRARAVKNVPGGARAKAGRSVADQEVAAMLRACLTAGTLIGLRDAAIIAVLQSTGIRREELAMATRAAYDPGERRLVITGKGGKSREVYLHEVAATYLGRWIAATEHIRGPLFVPINRWGTTQPRHLTPDAVADALNVRRLVAGLPPLTPHDLRRTFAGDLLDNGVDLARVQQLLGHASPVTTAGYDRRPGRQRKAAVDTLTLPRPEDLTSATRRARGPDAVT